MGGYGIWVGFEGEGNVRGGMLIVCRDDSFLRFGSGAGGGVVVVVGEEEGGGWSEVSLWDWGRGEGDSLTETG